MLLGEKTKKKQTTLLSHPVSVFMAWATYPETASENFFSSRVAIQLLQLSPLATLAALVDSLSSLHR
jgi:hypothetical protein